MKLWQKIFLISLAFVMLAVSTTAVFVARSSFTADIRRDREAAAERHHYIASNIVNKIAYERLRSGALTLPVNEMQAYAGDVVRQNAAEGAGIALYNGDDIEEGIEEAFLRLYAPPVGDFAGLAEALSVSEGPQSVICSIDGRDFLAVASRLQAEGATFILLTTSDISDTYESYDNMLRLIGFMSCGFAVAFSLALLAVTYRLLRPLDTVNASIGMIAAGAYDTRVPEAGGEEFTELARNVNTMAEAIEDNVSELTRIADSRKVFIDNLAHEMKTPLTSIVCMADVLRIKKDITDAERVEYAHIIVTEAQRLKNLSGKLMELIVAGNAELDLRDISVGALLAEAEQALVPVAAQREMDLIVYGKELEWLTIRADKELLLSLLYNLTDNAMKASSPGQTVEVACAEANGAVVLSVTDHGVGMDREQLRRVKEPFYMVDKSRSRKAGGAGLGLSLCVEIARRHRARFRIASRPGKGTKVTVTFRKGGAA